MERDYEFSFVVPGLPRAKQRHRHTWRGQTYTPSQTVHYEHLVKMMAREASGPLVGWRLRGQFRLHIEAFRDIPTSWPKVRQRLAAEGAIRPTSTPDWDNYGKIIADALNKEIWVDDSMVVSSTVEKYYTDGEPYARITITDITHPDDRWVRKG